MKKPETIFEKMFGSFAVGNSRVPIRSNVYNNGGRGYSPIGTTASKLFSSDRKSPILGNASPSNLLSGFYERISELKGYQLVDIAKLATNFYADYVVNFLTDDGNGRQILTILDQDGNNNNNATERINNILTKDINIFSYIKTHIQDYIYYGSYYSMLSTDRNDTGHIMFKVEEIVDPVSVVRKLKRDLKTGEVNEVYLAKGDDGTLYEIPANEVIYLAQNNLRLLNDLEEGWKERRKEQQRNPKLGKDGETNRDKVLRKESYFSSEPLLYSLILKIKELIIKELLVSLISLRDLSSVQIFLLQVDKSIPMESANELCAKATKLANNTNELASFLTSQFDAVSFIENTLSQSAKFVPDYNSTLGGKNSMLPLDKLSDKMLEIMQTLDQCRAGILSPLGLPSSITDVQSGNKWQILQQSERANSRVSMYISGIKDSVTSLVQNIYEKLYGEKLDSSFIKLHICEKTSVEYNNQINQSDSISTLLQGIQNILQNSLQTLDQAIPFVDPRAWLIYVQNLIRDIDPNTANLITEQTIENYLQVIQAKFNQQCMGIDLDPSQIQLIPPLDDGNQGDDSKLR